MSQDQLWESLAREKLEDVLEPEMVKQYRLRRGEQCVYMPRFGTERYLCSCGTVNPIGKKCYICGMEPEPLTRAVIEELRQEAEERLEKERLQREKEEAERAARQEAERRVRQRKKLLMLVAASVAVVLLLALGAVLFWFSTRVWIPAGHYQDGLEALEAGDLRSAHRSFVLAGTYEDARDYVARFYTPMVTVKRTWDYQVSETVYTYDGAGRLLGSTASVKEVLDDGEIIQEEPVVWEMAYDDAGRVLKRESFYGREEYTYNERGDVTSQESYRTDGVHDTTRIFTYDYDDAGRLLRRAEICSELISVNYSYEQIDTYTYDEAGRVLVKSITTNYPASVEANYVSEQVHTYDEAGRLIRREENSVAPNDVTGDCGVVEEWIYNDRGDEVRYSKTTVFPGESLRDCRQTVTKAFDEEGRLVEEVTQITFPNDPSRDMVSKTAYTYDKEGRCAYEFYSQQHSDAQRQLQSGYTHTVEYIYDLLGRVGESRVVWDYADGVESYVQTEEYAYNWDGSMKSCELVIKWRDPDRDVQKQSYLYNENGLVKQEYLSEDDSVTEYTYDWFYFPEGYNEDTFITPQSVSYYG